MKLTVDEIEKVAKLSRLALTEQEKKYYAEQLSGIFGYIEMLNEVDTEGVKATDQVTGLSDQTRPDLIVPSSVDMQKKLMDAFPEKQGNLLKVKAVFDKNIV